MYAAPNSPLSPCVALRLSGVLDADFIAAFRSTEREIGRAGRAIVLVDVRDLAVRHERDVAAIVEVIRRARTENRDVRLDQRTSAWRHAAVKHLSAVPPVDENFVSSFAGQSSWRTAARRRVRRLDNDTGSLMA